MSNLTLWYDQEADYLEVLFEDVPAAFDEISDDVLERRTPDGRVVGFAVLNFSKHDRSSLRLPWAVSALPPQP